jgi:hypothetical protein
MVIQAAMNIARACAVCTPVFTFCRVLSGCLMVSVGFASRSGECRVNKSLMRGVQREQRKLSENASNCSYSLMVRKKNDMKNASMGAAKSWIC